MATASPDYPMLCPVCNTGTPGDCDCLPADETDAEKRMNKSEQKPCGCRQGECETKADTACRMTAELQEQQEARTWDEERDGPWYDKKAIDSPGMRSRVSQLDAVVRAHQAAPQASPVNTPTHEHLSTMIGMVLGARQRGKMEYADGSVMDKNVKAAIEHLKDWPYPEQADPLAAKQAEREPLTLDEVRLLTCMHSGAPWHDQMVQVVRELLVIYEDLRAQNKRPFDPADLEGEEHDAYFRRLERLLSRPAT